MGAGTGNHQVDKAVADVSDRLLELTGEISAAANRMRLGQTTASAQVHTGSNTAVLIVGIVGVIATVIGVAGILISNAQREADARVYEARLQMQSETNENLTDRVAVLERIIARMEREQPKR